MKNLFALSLASLLVAGCQTTPITKVIPSGDQKIVWQYWNLKISCHADWGHVCEGEAQPQNEAVIPEGFSHCRTVAQKNSGPAGDAGSWWFLDGNRVRVFARACGGAFYDQYSSWIDVNWITYIVRTPSLNDPENNCSSETKGAADYELTCF
ncbi:hypothetical protein [Pseudomonas sp. 91RF]|uniref:hypothetical protein n=1 Tax=Pseudomonas sp. 91RF TaxID=2292261 RepID=UPI0011C38D93|nr:hypothetical protein [Pseudomonas sp. 91RF]